MWMILGSNIVLGKALLLDDPNGVFLVRRELKVKGTNAQILLAIILREGRVLDLIWFGGLKATTWPTFSFDHKQ